MIFMKRKTTNKTILFSTLFLLFMITVLSGTSGCKFNSRNNDESVENSIVFATLKLNAAVVSGRQASPMVDQEVLNKITFTVTAKDNNNKDPNTKNDDDYFKELDEENNGYTRDYRIKLNPGVWKITVSGFLDGKEILKGNKTLTIKKNGSYSEEIPLYFITAKEGNVDLVIDVSAVPDIVKLKITASGDNTLNNSTGYMVEQKNGKRIINIKPTGTVKSGTWYPILTFCTANDVPVFSIPEVITVAQNMTTKYWIKSAKNPFLKDADENGRSSFVVTPALISEVLNTVFYVNGNTTKSESNPYPGNSANSGNDYTCPLDKIENAFNRINVSNNNDYLQNRKQNYIIFIKEKAAASALVADNPLNLSIYTINNGKITLSGNLSTGKNINLSLMGTVIEENDKLVNNITVSNAFICNDGSTVTANNISFSRNVTAGYNPEAEDADLTLKNTASLIMNNCTIANTAYCYASTDGLEKCSITANNCTFKNTVTNYGTFTASSTDFEKNLVCYRDSSFELTALAADRKSIKGSVTLNDSSSAVFSNVNIGAEVASSTSNSIVLKNSSSAVFENVEVNKNIDAQSTTDENKIVTAHSNITFAGTTHFTGNVSSASSYVLNLRDGVVLKLKDVPAGDEKLAAIKVAVPSFNLPVIETADETQEIIAEQIERYELHNPGYYLAYDSESKKGVIKLSAIQVQEPTFGGCTITLNIDPGLSENGVYVLGKNDSPLDITVKVKDKDNNELNITSVKQYLGMTEISAAAGAAGTEKTISFIRDHYEIYSLEIRFIYNRIEYSTMLTVKISG